MWKPGEHIGPYEVIARLKPGGMGSLYLARRSGAAGFARQVAIKVVHAHLATDKSFVRMFVDEALLSARIQHPNVVHVEELAETDGTYYLVMEYVQGCALTQLLNGLARVQRSLSPDVAASIAMQAADGLHAAHETRGDDGELLGVVHRDVSPQNILLSDRGNVKLIDFGIAKARGRTQMSATGTIKGKIRYMAPEQAFGRAVDRRTDVYALGIVLWEMLTGRHLFTGENDFAVLDRVRAPQTVPPSRHAEGISAALDAVVMAALAPEPDQRPATALELRCRLAEAAPHGLVLGPAQLARLLDAVVPPSSASAPGSHRAGVGVDASDRARAAAAPTASLALPGGAANVATASHHGTPASATSSDDDVLATLTVLSETAEMFDDDGAALSLAETDVPPLAIPPAAASNAFVSSNSRWKLATATMSLVVVLALGALAIRPSGSPRAQPSSPATRPSMTPASAVAEARHEPTAPAVVSAVTSVVDAGAAMPADVESASTRDSRSQRRRAARGRRAADPAPARSQATPSRSPNGGLINVGRSPFSTNPGF